MRIEESGLLEPISADQPCGEDLEDTQLLASFDAFRLFGQTTPLSAETDWRDIRDRSLEALGKSKDFRLLCHLGAAVLRTDGLEAFAATAAAASTWLETWWGEVYPKVDEDAILRRNALNGLADRMAIVDGLRRTPILVHRQLGSFSIRDIEIATGQQAPTEADTTPPDAAQLNAMLAASSVEELTSLRGKLEGCLTALKGIEAKMRSEAGSDGAPDFSALLAPLGRTTTLVVSHLDTRMPAASGADGANGQAVDGAAGGLVAVGNIRTRDDAVRALDAVATFFKNNEPASPVPLFIERAKRLVGKDFLSVLEDIVPDALAQAKSAGGVRDSE
jgi:type VI secretion system protein ImpA